MDRLLVIGSSGLLGGRVVELFKDKYNIYGTYNTHEIGGSNMFRLDSTDRDATFKLVEKVKPDFVIDTHSLNNLDQCETHHDEAWRINVDGSRNVAEACKNFGCKYIFMSTDYVFDGKKMKYTEKDKPHPLSYLARTKVIVEQMLWVLDVNYVVARTSVIYGKGGLNKVSFARWLIEKLKKGEQVKIVSDQLNNPTFVDDLAEQIIRLYEKGETGIFHVTGKECLSRLDFSNEIAETFGLDKSLIVPITTPDLNQIAVRPGRVNMSTEKVERATGVKTLTVKEGLALLKDQFGDES